MTKKKQFVSDKFVAFLPVTVNIEDVVKSLMEKNVAVKRIPKDDIDWSTPHETKTMLTLGESASFVQIDEKMVPLIRRLWSLGVTTYYCCEGHDVPKRSDPYRRKYEGHRAYVMMKDDSVSRLWVSHLIANFGPDIPQNFTIDTDEGPRSTNQGARITVRFPKVDIERLIYMTESLYGIVK